MHQEKNIRKLLLKYVENSCSDEEYEEILHYFQDRSASEEMPTVEEVLEILDEHKSLDEHSANRIYRKIVTHKSGNPDQRSKGFFIHSKMRKFAVAATILLLVVAGFLYQQGHIFSGAHLEMIAENSGHIDLDRSEDITLELGNGQVEVIHPDGSRTVRDELGNIVGQQDKTRLVYSGERPVDRLEYNTLRIPYSKRFQIVLSDGTVVHLNAGTTMKFPVNFPQNSPAREIEVSGEAYFEVAHHPDQPFVVNTGDMDVRVLGTKFNVSTYPEDERTDVVLVEGSVNLETKNEQSVVQAEQLLEPGHKASFDKSDKTITTVAVPTSIYTSWINGELVFRDMKFDDILLKLERKYNVSIVNTNIDLAKERFNASFGDVPLDTVLKYLETIYGMHYTMEGDTVIIE